MDEHSLLNTMKQQEQVHPLWSLFQLLKRWGESKALNYQCLLLQEKPR